MSKKVNILKKNQKRVIKTVQEDGGKKGKKYERSGKARYREKKRKTGSHMHEKNTGKIKKRREMGSHGDSKDFCAGKTNPE
ncbi:MAG: hypothetical protein HYV45_01080 [Candidatus Moranbacteria bacterium]|nr:hypothetical protein [Candidatus Moranbacteria bacterium]